VEIEQDLVATATGDADRPAAHRVEAHVARCARCEQEYRQYRALDGAIGAWRGAPPPAAAVGRARDRLESRLERLRHRAVVYQIFPSPLGNILIALSGRGVSLVEYLGRSRDLAHSRLSRVDVEPLEDGAEVEALYRELMEYLTGRRTRLDWPLDLRLVRSAFHRSVLETTASIPYGAVTSYAGLACAIGKPAATRAVAQALRWNPLPIVVPCHRVVGTSGALTGYAGDRVGLKERLLSTEGVPISKRRHDPRVPREVMYVRTPDSEYYCLPSCDWLTRVEHPNRLILFGSPRGAESAGLRPCGECRPDLHPLPR
jgi:methylated-DNA-[protein]-cysteine S-methyltransferase